MGRRPQRGAEPSRPTAGASVLVVLAVAGLLVAGSAAPAGGTVTSSCAPGGGGYAGAVAGTSGLVGYWRLGEQQGSSSACDSAGGSDGAYQGAVSLGLPGAIAGDPNTAAGFDGASASVQIPDQPQLEVGDRFTIEAWIKRGQINSTANQVIAAKQNGAWVLMFNPANQLVLRRSNAADIATSTTTLTDTDNWHYVAATKDGPDIHLYLDGQDVTGTTSNLTMTDNTLPLAIGNSSNSAYYNGDIDEVALYNTALTPDQIQTHYTLATPTQAPGNTDPPTITGTPQTSQTLTAQPGTWTGTTAITYTYQWQRCDTNGSPCADIPDATSTTYTATDTDVGATLRVAVTASDTGGSAHATSAPTSPVAPAPEPQGDPVIAAAGDIACDPTSSSFNAGLGTSTACDAMATSNLLLSRPFAAVLALGDNQYGCGGLAAYALSYELSWGRVKLITHPVPGNHEYQTSGGTDCDTTGNASGYYTYFGSAAGDPTEGYYSFDVGSWHLIALNSNCDAVGGCWAGSPQETWLREDLAAHPAQCTLAYWHHPRFTSGSVGETTAVAPLWQDLYAAGADVILNGHAHGYERFAPQDPNESYDPVNGLREFVVGTGGEDFHSFVTNEPLSETREDTTFGILTLTLHADGYDWSFLPAAGGIYADSGSGSCH